MVPYLAHLELSGTARVQSSRSRDLTFSQAQRRATVPLVTVRPIRREGQSLRQPRQPRGQRVIVTPAAGSIPAPGQAWPGAGLLARTGSS